MRGTSDATRGRILQAATELFYAGGIHCVGVDAIAERAGLTKRTLYYHFKSKDELIAAYLESRNEPVLASLTAAVTEIDGSLAEQIRGLFSRLERAVRSPEWKGCPFIRAVTQLSAPPDRATMQVASGHKKTFEGWLRLRFAEEGLRDPTLLARQIMVLMDGAATEMMISRDSKYAAAAGKAAVALVAAAQPGKRKKPR